MKGALEIVEYFKSGKMHPNEIFSIYEEVSNLSEEETEVYIKSGIGDAIEMSYITAVEMRKKGTWEGYIKRWEERKNKTPMELLREYMDIHGIEWLLDNE